MGAMNFPFDMIGAARAGYQFVIHERAYLLRLAVVPILIKLVCYVTAVALGYQDNMLRMALILLPASLVEGWMLSHMVRLIMLGQRWPFQPTGDDAADFEVLKRRMQGVMGGLVCYALINVLVAGVFALMTWLMPEAAEGQKAAVDPLRALAAVSITVASFWAFPLLWIFIPLATSMDPASWARRVIGWRFSLPLIGVWIMCFLPVVTITMIGVSAIVSPFAVGEIPEGARFAVIILSVILDTVKAVIGTAGITFALADYYKKSGQGS